MLPKFDKVFQEVVRDSLAANFGLPSTRNAAFSKIFNEHMIFLAPVLRQKFSRHRKECLVFQKEQSDESLMQLCQQVESSYILINTTNNNDSPVKIEMDITSFIKSNQSPLWFIW
ncbi:unnamed protein product [Rotaria sordida]|uniref:Uncharacterized protein n=1 Tax=Rotaria sordida TaxID=392033 RepID=A0A814UW16_9BILA|nr:unnamed protein product [Rotaria sordida]